MIFGQRQPLVEDGREDDLRWKMTFTGRQPLVEDDLQWKTTFGGRQPLVEDNFWWKTILAAYSALRHFLIPLVPFY